MATRKIVGFNDDIEFEVVNDQIRIIDNGPLYKNKLKNGLFLDTLCSMDVQYEDVICEELVENVEEKKCVKLNYDTELLDERRIQHTNKRQKNDRQKNDRRQNKRQKKINEKEKKRRNKRKMLKVGNQYYDDDIIINKITIPTNHFGKTEADKYAPLCNNCFVFAMLSKRYYMLYKCSYVDSCCPHIKCWMCKDECKYVCKGENFCTIECYDNKRQSKYTKKYGRSCTCGEEYGYDYGKKYKCGQYFMFNFIKNINYDYYLGQNENIIIENVNFEDLKPVELCECHSVFDDNSYYSNAFDSDIDYFEVDSDIDYLDFHNFT